MLFFVEWEYILWFSFIVMCIAYLIDFAMGKEHRVRLSEAINQQMSSEHFSYSSTVAFTNVVFCNVFDTIYGSTSLSIRRVALSSVFSVIFVSIMVLLFGYDNTLFAGGAAVDVIAVFVMTNLAADFISLTETRWVLGKARGQRIYILGLWFIADIVLTTLIYYVVLYFSLLGYFNLQNKPYGPTFMEGLAYPYDKPLEYANIFLKIEFALPFFLSTYATSIVWFFFVASALIVRVLSGSPRMFRMLAHAINLSDAPTRIVGVVVIALVLFVSAIAEIVYQLF